MLTSEAVPDEDGGGGDSSSNGDGDEWSYEAAPFPELTSTQVRAIAARHGLDVGADDAAIERLPSTGVINSIWALGDRWVLRVPKPVGEGISDTRTEAVAAPVAHAAGVRTPALVAFDDSGELVDGPYTIYERVHGDTLDAVARRQPPAALAAVLEDLGTQLARLHRDVTSCPDPRGWLDDAGRFDDHQPLLDKAGEAGRWLDDVLTRLQPVVHEDAAGHHHRFLHNDVQASNVLVTRDKHEAVLIDWGDAAWGDPALDLRTLPPFWLPTVLAGYRAVMPFDDDATVEQRIVWDVACRALYYAARRPAYLAELRAFAVADPPRWAAWTGG